ncbi:MAG: DUF167 family protein, partial [Spirochaetaceae bacterium]|nr:DUF167 family protein [Spirochaetaceae bacterium]
MADPARLTVRVTPRAGRDTVEGWVLDAEGRPLLKLRVAAAPADGAANSSVVALVAKALKTPRSSVRIAAGDTARIKRLEIAGCGSEEIVRA